MLSVWLFIRLMSAIIFVFIVKFVVFFKWVLPQRFVRYMANQLKEEIEDLEVLLKRYEARNQK